MKTPLEVSSKNAGPIINFREIWEYKYLMLLFIRRDFVAKYKQNILGPSWFIIQPLLMTGIFTVIFGGIAGIETGKMPSTLFYLCGLSLWNYFAQGFTANSSILLTQAPLYTKVYFPRMSLPIANVIANLIAYAVQLLLFGMFFAYYKFQPETANTFGVQPTIVLVPLLVAMVGAFGLGCGLWMSALTAKYRDLVQLSAFFVQMAMYVSPVIFPMSEVPSFMASWIRLNPMTGVIEAYRYCLLGEGIFSWQMLGYSSVVILLVMFSGMIIFQRVQKSFVDSV